MYDLIRKKRDGGTLRPAEIRWFIEGVTDGSIPDYQISALLMAIYYQGMNLEETKELTFAIRDSGEKLDFSSVEGIRADKHSTGGVGDKTSLVVVPVVASLGVKVAKISGRGLGHTGGTIDKLESIPGFRTDIPEEDFIAQVNRIGAAIIGQTHEIAPADKKLYALRDVTATVDSLPLIVSSIMGKKLAADDDVIVLDVKTGSGAFMKTVRDSRRLAQTMVEIGKAAGKKITALITDMDRPLGSAIGNALEVIESIETLKGSGPKDLTDLCMALSAEILYLSGKGESLEECDRMARESIRSGSAREVLSEMIRSQGGNPDVISDYSLFGTAAETLEVCSDRDGFISGMDTEGIGRASLLLGAGRNTLEDVIDNTAGILLLRKTGDRVKTGDPIAKLLTSSPAKIPAAKELLLQSLTFTEKAPRKKPLVLDRIS